MQMGTAFDHRHRRELADCDATRHYQFDWPVRSLRRDAANRITQITDPQGNIYQYA